MTYINPTLILKLNKFWIWKKLKCWSINCAKYLFSYRMVIFAFFIVDCAYQLGRVLIQIKLTTITPKSENKKELTLPIQDSFKVWSKSYTLLMKKNLCCYKKVFVHHHSFIDNRYQLIIIVLFFWLVVYFWFRTFTSFILFDNNTWPQC